MKFNGEALSKRFKIYDKKGNVLELDFFYAISGYESGFHTILKSPSFENNDGYWERFGYGFNNEALFKLSLLFDENSNFYLKKINPIAWEPEVFVLGGIDEFGNFYIGIKAFNEEFDKVLYWFHLRKQIINFFSLPNFRSFNNLLNYDDVTINEKVYTPEHINNRVVKFKETKNNPPIDYKNIMVLVNNLLIELVIESKNDFNYDYFDRGEKFQFFREAFVYRLNDLYDYDFEKLPEMIQVEIELIINRYFYETIIEDDY